MQLVKSLEDIREMNQVWDDQVFVVVVNII